MKAFRSILLYAVSLALLTVALRMLEYKLLIIDHALELYIGAIAVLFTGVGIWAGGSLRNRVRHTPLIGPESLIADRLSEYAAAGLEHAFVWPVIDEVAQLDRFAERIMPRFA